MNGTELMEIVKRWAGDAKVDLALWDKGNYARVYIIPNGNRKYKGFADTNGQVQLHNAYVSSMVGLSTHELRELLQEAF